MMVMWLFGMYFVLLVVAKTESIELFRGEGELFPLGLSVILGYLIAEIKNPLKSVGELRLQGGWWNVYKQTLATPALIVGPTYGAIKIIEYLIYIVLSDPQAAPFVVFVCGLVIVAVFEVIRREISR